MGEGEGVKYVNARESVLFNLVLFVKLKYSKIKLYPEKGKELYVQFSPFSSERTAGLDVPLVVFDRGEL